MKATIRAAALMALMVPAQAASPPKIKYPEFYEMYWREAQCFGKRFFDCNYTTKNCLSGYSASPPSGVFAGVTLAEDRRTVLAHVVHANGYWFNVDTGEVQDRSGIIPMSTDIFKVSPELMEENWHNLAPDYCGKPYEQPPE